MAIWDSQKRLGASLLLLGGSGLALCGAWLLWRRRETPCACSHLRVGRIWEYDVEPGGAVETTEVMDSWLLPDGRCAYRVDYRRGDTVIDAVFTQDAGGNLVQLSQSKGTATFDPPLVGLGKLRVGVQWSTTSWMIFPSMFRASDPTELSGRIVALEEVTVPAGTFRAFKIEQVTNGKPSTTWYVPDVGMVREICGDEDLKLRRIIDQRRASPPTLSSSP